MFRNDLDAIDVLRREAVNVREPHASGVRKLQAYAAQLVWIGGKFPIDVSATPCFARKKQSTNTEERISLTTRL
jgi:hypothetical protein